ARMITRPRRRRKNWRRKNWRDAMAEIKTALAEQYENLEQQKDASRLGMWTFLATEVLFFGGLFLAYIVYRFEYPEAFAVASRHTNVMYGTINTAILLTSSLWMAL